MDHWPDDPLGYLARLHAALQLRGIAVAQSLADDLQRAVQDNPDDLAVWGAEQAYVFALAGELDKILEPLALASRDGYNALLLAYSTGDSAFFAAWADSASNQLATGQEFDYAEHFAQAIQSIVFALEGNVGEAERLGRQILAEWPLERDGYTGLFALEHWNLLQVLIGDLEGALETSRILLAQPSFMNRFRLLHEPWYEPLRNHPGFAELVESPGR